MHMSFRRSRQCMGLKTGYRHNELERFHVARMLREFDGTSITVLLNSSIASL